MARVRTVERALRLKDLKRFLEKVQEGPDECWIWTGGTVEGPRGFRYGIACMDGERILAHRAAYEFFVGIILGGYCVDHLCGNTLCVNPDHLEAVTFGKNIRRSLRWSKERLGPRWTHCKHGHPLSGQNLYIWKRADGRVERRCRACNAEAHRRFLQRLKQRPPDGQIRPGPITEHAACVAATIVSGIHEVRIVMGREGSRPCDE